MFHPGKNPVTFESEGVTLAGDLFLPGDYQDGERYPALVVTGSWTTVKEQMARLYAERMADEGYAALVFDFRYYGQSGGEPRQYESPEHKIQDIQNAVTYLLSLPLVDNERVGGLGVCASSGYLAHAAGRDDRLKSLAFVAPWLHDAELVAPLYGGAGGVAQRTEAGREAKEKYDATGDVDFIPAASDTDESAAMYGPFAYYLDPERGGIPAWTNALAVMSWPEWLGFDALSAAPKIAVPLFIVHSEAAAVPEGTKRFLEGVEAPKDILWTDGTQFDFYDQEPQVSIAVEAVDRHFGETLQKVDMIPPAAEV